MQTKIYNAYRITHKDGSVEDINALDVCRRDIIDVVCLESVDDEERLRVL